MSFESILLQSWNEFIKILPFLVIAVIFGKIIEVFMPKKFVKKFLGKNNSGIFVGTILGLFKPGPLYVALPVLNGFMKKGMSFAALSAYLTSSLIGGLFRFFIEVGYFGWKYAILRVIITILISIGTGYIFLFFENRHFFKKKVHIIKKSEVEKLKREKLKSVYRLKAKEKESIEKTREIILKK